MLPKLTALQWVIFLVFLFFYGFTVFGITRDYYIRHPPRLPAAAQGTHQVPTDRDNTQGVAQTDALGNRMRQALEGQGADGGIDLGSTDPLALGDAADRLFAARQFEAAIPIYRRVLELEPADAETHNDLGLALHYTGRAPEALQVLQQGTELDPDFQRIWLSLGFVALQNGDSALAREALERAQALDPDTEVADEAARLLGMIEGG